MHKIFFFHRLLLQGQIKVATLPDPLAKSAQTAGAGRVVDDSAHPQYSVSVLSFSVNSLQTKADAVRLFLKAWDHAAADINANAEAHRTLRFAPSRHRSDGGRPGRFTRRWPGRCS